LLRGNGVDNPSGRVASTVFLRKRAIDLNQRSKVDPLAERGGDRVKVRTEAVCRQLETAVRGVAQLDRELAGVFRAALAEMPRQNEFGCPLDCREAVGVPAVLAEVVPVARALFGPNEPPNFIGLHVLHVNAADDRFQEPLAILPRFHHRTHNGVTVRVCSPFCGTNRAALKQHLQAKIHAGRINPATVHGSRCAVCERGLAHVAPIALRAVPVSSKATRGSFAVEAKHDEPPFLVAAVRLE
jgi:hypothetical protein